MRALITGGAGFIGSHLAEELLERGYEISVLDDLSTGKISNIGHLESHPGFSFKTGSIMDESLLSSLIERSDVIFHLAAVVGVKLMLEDLVKCIDTITHGTRLVLGHAAEKKKRVVFVSSSEVYGKNACIPFKEEDNLILGPTSCGRWSYGCAKLIGEFLAMAYWKEDGLPVLIVRLFNTVGPRQSSRYGMVMPRFIQQALSDQPITVFGDGRQSRCFTCVTDVVEAMVNLSEHPEAFGQIFNIGSEEEVTIQELAMKIKELTGSKSEVRYIPYEVAYKEGFQDLRRRVPSLQKIRRYIRYEPLCLDEILVNIVEHHRSKSQTTIVPVRAFA